MPKCRKVDSVVRPAAGGKDYYAALVGQHTTTDLTPDQIHQIGLQEVARIRAEMEEVAKKAGFASREAMIADMRTNPKWYVKTPEELLEKTAIVTKTIDGKMPGLFGRLAAPALRHPADGRRDRPDRHHGALPAGQPGRRASPASISSTRPSSTSGRCGKSRCCRCTRRCPAITCRSRSSRSWRCPLAQGDDLLHRLRRRLGPLFGAARHRHGPLRHAAEGHGTPRLSDVARDPAGGRHGHPFQGLGQGAGGCLHEGQYDPDRRQHRRGGQPLHLRSRARRWPT